MRSICPSNKIYYHHQEEAEEALIQNLGRSHYANGAGPVNIYQCDLCDGFHFTSKGVPHSMLQDPVVKARIARLRQASDWETKF